MTDINAHGETAGAEMWLGKAFHELKPTLTQDQVNDSVKKAEKEAAEAARLGN